MIENTPFVSIVIPALNESEFISACLESINNIDYPKDSYEVIVADNGSTDDTQLIARNYGATVCVYPDVRIGKLRNLGVQNAKGDVIAFVDADCIVPNNWIKDALSTLCDDGVGVVGGKCHCRLDANWIEKAWALNKGELFCDVSSLATGSFILTKKVFSTLGGFNEELIAGEDTEISQRVLDMGLNLKLNSKCDVIHLGYPRTIPAFIKRQIWQTSDYLNTLKSGIDKTFIFTATFLLSFIVMNIAFVLGLHGMALFFLVNILTLVLLATIFRINNSVETVTLVLCVTVFSVQMLYFIGRSIGLTISLLKKIKIKDH